MLALPSGSADDRGVVGVYIAVIFVAFVLITGLIVDGGAIRSGRRDAGDIAARAARAGAQEINVDLLMGSGDIELEPLSAAAAARSVLAQSGTPGSVSVGRDAVTVSVRSVIGTRLLSVIGIGQKVVTATRTARAAEGVVDG